MVRVCFECGDSHEGLDVVCEPCRARLAKQPEDKMSRAERFLANERKKALKSMHGDSFISMFQMFISLLMF